MPFSQNIDYLIYAAVFSSRVQRNGKTAEDYAADLIKVVDKAHIYMDRHTRVEDLVRRYVNGLVDLSLILVPQRKC